MADHIGGEDQIRREAANWVARLNSRSIETRALEDFFEWRRLPAHAAAYEEVEKIWEDCGRISPDPEMILALQGALERPKRGRMRVQAGLLMLWARPVVAASLVFAAVGLLGLYIATMPVSYETGIGEQRLVRLDDGSRVHLNTDSEMRVRLTSDRRGVEIVRGEALFEVAHDSARPFIVRSDRGEVQALGTRFDVRRLGSDTRVILLEGSVRVHTRGSPDSADETLAPGQSIWLGPGRKSSPEAVDAEAVTSWTSGQLTFQDTPLREAIAEVNRYTDTKIVLEAEDLAGVAVNGVFDTGDTAAFVTAVTALFPLHASSTGDRQIQLRRIT